MGQSESEVLRSLERLFGDRGVKLSELAAGQSLAEALDWDSMDVVDLGMEFKRSLGVELPEDVEQIDSIAKLVALVDAGA
ncbi:MAG: acyl carrier protein [Alphaproteobacteria bacterium]|nr:acyl carrier protein [Alphaproteobacteria bacterium]MCB9794486.1 acyl carrier protein [Alphaproteobacteria bacterium]